MVTPSLFDLPLRPGAAAALAGILLSQPGIDRPRAVTDELRSRLAARAAGTSFKHLTPLFPSLERDPIHPSAFYLCVDGVDLQPLLLRIAPAATPSSGLFPKAILIGRTFVAGSEILLNVVPFAASDRERILAFVTQVNPVFQPGSAGNRPVVLISSQDPRGAFPAVFESAKLHQRSTGPINLAFGRLEDQDPAEFCFTTMWAAVRTGWRDGFTLHSRVAPPSIPGLRRRPFEAELVISREVALSGGANAQDTFQLLR